jgi:hypothetical protein
VTKNKWQFQENPPNLGEDEKILEEFFSNADVVGEVAGLVRESVQNSLDEVFDSSKPIKVVFTVGKQSSTIAKKYFTDLYPHIKETPDLRDIPELTEESNFIAIEDFNTLGLEGPTVPTAPSKSDLDNPKKAFKFSFWFFEWKTGGSNKGDGKRGTWGVGKIVFPRASRIKTYLVFSVRSLSASPAGNTAILFGHTILKFRELLGKKYRPDCRWMVEESSLSVPSVDSQEHQQFVADWKLSRKSNELGTSIVVPFCRDSVNARALVEAIIRDYFIAILGGQLECVVKDDVHETVINKSTIISLLGGFSEDDLPSGVRSKDELKILCDMYLEYETSSTTKIKIPLNSASKNDWSVIEFSDDEAKVITEAFGAGKTVELTVEVEVPEMTSPHCQKGSDHFTVLLKGVPELRSVTVFCREGILIPAANSNSNLQNCVSIVLVGNMVSSGSVSNSVANLLKNAEGPSHESWSSSASKFKDLYRPKTNAESTIRYVKVSALRCLRLIHGAENVEDDTTLVNYFPEGDDVGPLPGEIKVVLSGRRDRPDGDRAILSWQAHGFTPISYVLKRLTPTELDVKSGIEASGETIVDFDLGPDVVYRFQMTMTDGTKSHVSNVVTFSPPVDPPTKAKIQIQPTDSGFEIFAGSGEDLKPGYRFEVRAAYRARRVNSMKWSEEDFLLSNQMRKSKTKGLRVVKEDENYCQLEVVDPEIYALWDDFDVLRDLIVKAEEI